MCQDCVDACREIFPEVPDEEMGTFLYGTTCFPFGEPEQVKKQLVSNRERMTTDDWNECYAIADTDTAVVMSEIKEKEEPPNSNNLG